MSPFKSFENTRPNVYFFWPLGTNAWCFSHSNSDSCVSLQNNLKRKCIHLKSNNSLFLIGLFCLPFLRKIQATYQKHLHDIMQIFDCVELKHLQLCNYAQKTANPCGRNLVGVIRRFRCKMTPNINVRQLIKPPSFDLPTWKSFVWILFVFAVAIVL